jgi:hypothetical protein
MRQIMPKKSVPTHLESHTPMLFSTLFGTDFLGIIWRIRIWLSAFDVVGVEQAVVSSAAIRHQF